MTEIRYRLESHLFSVPKRGLRLEQMEDAAWPRTRRGTDGWSGRLDHGTSDDVRLAIADGATESVFSRAWAWALVRAYGTGRLDEISEGSLARARRVWLRTVRRELARLERTPSGVPWYLEAKLARGAFATLLGLRLRRDENGWAFEANAVGDSCLLWIDELGDRVEKRFPLTHAADFAKRPILLSTDSDTSAAALGAQHQWSGRLEGPSQMLLLATDAFAEWLYTGIEAGAKPWVHEGLDELDASNADDRQRFEELVTRCRAAQLMRNDDVVFLRIRVEPER